MEDIRIDLDEKLEELDCFLDHLGTLDSQGSTKELSLIERSGDVHKYIIDSSFVKTLKASTYLLLYNVVESTVSQAMEFIHSEFSEENVDVSDLNPGLQNEIVRQIRNNLDVDFIRGMSSPLGNAVVSSLYRKKGLISGNIDGKQISNIGKRYGFRVKPSCDPKKLEFIKDQRNTLAHGESTFVDIGSQSSFTELKAYRENVETHLKCFLDTVEEYLLNKAYLLNCLNE